MINEAESQSLALLSETGSTPPIKNLQALNLQRMIHVVGMFSVFEAYLQRRLNCRYGKQNRVLAYVAKIFWGYSDYGRSLKQTILSIFKINLIFPMIYFFFPSLIHGLNGHDFIGSIYFSFVTMTTLGFGDMYAADSSIARCIVVIQVLYGYVLLGALITVLSTLFTSDGPAQGLIKHPKHAPIKITFT